MKQKLLSISVLTAAWLGFNAGPIWAQASGGTPGGKSGGSSSKESPTKGAVGSLGESQSTEKPGSSQGMGTSQDKSVSGAKGGGQKWAAQDVKQAQEALKSAGHDPGPIDGIMGPQTRQAIRAFQGQSGLKETGTLDAETAQKLGVEKGGSASGPSSGEKGSSSAAGKESGGAGKGQSSSTQKESSPMGK
ncbi:MAG: peptidoglycan-binding domain-containing protein [Candidatus Binatia bacterium]